LARSDQAHEADDGGIGAERPAEAHGEGERRRRRRGRRGGRRNRRGRAGESFAPGTAPGPGLASARHDLPPPPARSPAQPPPGRRGRDRGAAQLGGPGGVGPPPAEPRPQGAPSAQIAGPVPEPTAAEPPRRRSTVREPAPQTSRDEASAPAPSFTPPAPSIEP